ncbi:MAG: DUF262 domain-containing protein [Propionibacteriales bacterium]|nr:DUF262 domain-containing protein [Propionibacteriales bacterium]
MDSKSLVFLGLINGPRQYRIPSFQRSYSWERDERETLWLDLLTQYAILDSVWEEEPAVQEQLLTKQSTHYLGTIVLSGPSALGVPKSDIIDGQQRITTLLLAICAMRDHWGTLLSKADGPAEAESKRRTISNTYLINDGQAGNERFRLLPLSTDEKVFKAIVEFAGSGKLRTEDLGLEPGDSDRMLRAYQFFRTEMARKAVPENNVQLKRFESLFPLDPAILEQALAHRMSVIAIETKNNDDTNAIFESLNAKGRPLTQLDLLRNYIFMTLGVKAEVVLNEDWLPIEKTHLPNRLDVEAFVWADVVSRGTNVLQKRTYRTIQSELREVGATVIAAEDYVKRLKRRAPAFAQILDPSKAATPALKSALEHLSKAGGKTARPLLLWLFEEHSTERCDHDELVRCIAHIESFLVRRFLCQLAPNNLNSMFGIMLTKLNNAAGPLSEGAGSVEDRLVTALTSVPKDWPDDQQLEVGILSHDFYHYGDVRQRTHILRTLDLSFGYDLIPGYDESDQSVEHILPQSRTSNDWIADLKALGDDLTATQDRWLHTLGNLTVVSPSNNSSLGNKRFPLKAEIYQSTSYKLTRAVVGFSDLVAGENLWGSNSIAIRGKSLAEMSAQLWARPEAGPLQITDNAAPPSDGSEFGDTDGSDIVPFTSSIEEFESNDEASD